MNLKENLSIAKEIAREAGDFLLDNKNKTKQIFSEEGRDIKLEIDRATETRIKKSLKDTGIPVLGEEFGGCLLYTSPSPRDMRRSRMPSSA